jgi:hypothetical protein
MKISTYISCFALVMPLLSGCANGFGQTETSASPNNDPRACAKNFSHDGSLFSLSGVKYMTHAVVPAVQKKDAIERAAKQIALDGLTVNTIDKEGGLITASNHVTAGNGDAVPMVVTVASNKGGVEAQLNFSTRFGQHSSDEDVRNEFCNIVAAMGRK